MIDVITWATTHEYGDALASQARLRQRMFIECRNVDHASFDGLEYDRFDTPAAVYLLWRDGDGVTRGMTRLLRTTMPYMIQTLWPTLVEGGNLPDSPRVWEGTRLCVDISLPREMRQRILAEILCGVTEYLHAQGAERLLAVSARMVAMRLFKRDLTWLGAEARIEGRMEAAFSLPVGSIEPAGARSRYGFGASVLNPSARGSDRRAA